MKQFLAAAIIVSSVVAHAQQADSLDGTWRVRKLEWTIEDENNYSAFVQALGRSKCDNVDACIRNPANPYSGTDPEAVKFYSDCADFPYFLRSYFAWKNDLPFAYVSQVRSFDEDDWKKNPPPPPPPDTIPKPFNIRYSELGNYPTARRTLVPRDDQGNLNYFREMVPLQNNISSAMMRIGAQVETSIANDFYSPALKPGSIHPGTVVYDPNGHVIVIYDVLPDGRLLYFDAHPDNLVTHGMFSSKFMRSRPAAGAGFKNFRPMKLVNAKKAWWGQEYFGGRLVFARNSEIPDYSETQYFGTNPDPTDWRKGTFVLNGRTLDYHEYVRRAVATEKINPVQEMEGVLHELCEDMQERMELVTTALNKGIHQQNHPPTIPANIFGASGDWESYSSPGRDARLRTEVVEIQKSVKARYTDWLNNDFSNMKYDGDDLKKELLRSFHKVNLECPVSYKNSAGRTVQLGLELAFKRLFRMSYDPYHCPELRWGAATGAELETCADDEDKRHWYQAEQMTRNSNSRDWSAPIDITIDMLESGRFGSATTPDTDLRTFLQNLPPKGGQ